MHCLQEPVLWLLHSSAAPASKTHLSRIVFAHWMHHISLRRQWIMGCGTYPKLLEQWACTKLKGNHTISTLSVMQKECSSIINGTLSKSVILDIYLPFYWSYMSETVSNSKQALMNYTNYNAKVIDQYHMKLVGWTFYEFKSLFDIHTIDDIRLLLEALQSGSCF